MSEEIREVEGSFPFRSDPQMREPQAPSTRVTNDVKREHHRIPADLRRRIVSKQSGTEIRLVAWYI